MTCHSRRAARRETRAPTEPIGHMTKTIQIEEKNIEKSVKRLDWELSHAGVNARKETEKKADK